MYPGKNLSCCQNCCSLGHDTIRPSESYRI
uniref:Uncharacterized protein n=1 Tax=Anguilla anguilla TaxID=7936 RepID=A0A0E9TAR5_ANGAN